MKNIILCVLCLSFFSSLAQDEEVKVQKIKWTNMVQLGQQFSNNKGVSGQFTMSLTSGVKYKKLMAGVELALSDYLVINVGSVGLYGKYDIVNLNKKHRLYGYGLVGYGSPFSYKDENIFGTNGKGGLLYGGGAGFYLPLGKIALLLQAGFKLQKISFDNSKERIFYNELRNSLKNYVAPADYKEINTRKMGRIEVKFGIQF